MRKDLQTLLSREITLKTEDGRPFEAPPDGSLGLLALGYQGLAAWRQARERAGLPPAGHLGKPPGFASRHTREHASPPKPASPPTSNQSRRKLLLIGWDGADWKLIDQLLDAGQMPSLESLVNQGVMGKLATLEPPFSPMLWTSIATGKLADKHGILGFTEPRPDRLGIRPVTSTSRKVKAIWNILTQQQMRTHVVGWWPSHPAEPINGVCVSNFYQRAERAIDKPWPLLPGTVHPPYLHDLFAWLRVHPAELTAEHVAPFVPQAAKVNQDQDKRLESLARILADTATVHAAATWVLDHQEWDLMAVYYDALDHFSHGFMNFHPPQMRGVPDDMFDLYRDVVSGGYRFHDMLLGRLLELAGDDATVMLISDHGFHSDHLRPAFVPQEPAGPAYQHRPYGVFCLKGPGIRQDELLFGATLLDITPTILTLFDLPVGEDMDGKPLTQAFEEPVDVTHIPSWEDAPGPCGMHSPDRLEDPYESQTALQQLVDLGYIEEPGDNILQAVDRTIRESRYNLARVYLGSNRFAEALPILADLSEHAPGEARFALRLARSYKETGDFMQAREVLDNFREQIHAQAAEFREQYGEESDGDTHRETPSPSGKDGEKAPEAPHSPIADDTQKEARRRLFQNRAALLQGQILEGDMRLEEGRAEEALALYRAVHNAAPQQHVLRLQIGNALLKLSRRDRV